MFTVCIPVYNYDVRSLVHSLHRQASDTGLPFEILLIDDASDGSLRAINESIRLPNLRYIGLDTNIGRSAIRNMLCVEAAYRFLIYMDCDSEVCDGHYIERYVECFKEGVICAGGRAYDPVRPYDARCLRWKYGVKRESFVAYARAAEGGIGFMTCNFLADRNVIINTPFDTTLSGYGHEDTLFGIELTAGGHTITHIDNPLIHKGLEDATTFLTKTAESITNLTAIKRILATKYHRTLPPTRLTLAHKTLSRYHLLPITAAILTLLKPLILRNLRSPHPSLHLFDAYKLYLLITHTPGASRKPIQARN